MRSRAACSLSRGLLLLAFLLPGLDRLAADPPLAASASSASKPVPESRLSPPGLRLPRQLLPQSNRVRIVLDPARESFEGRIEIEARALAPWQVFWLNARSLVIDKATVETRDTLPLELLQGNEQVIGFRAPREIPAGPITVTIDYSGKIDDNETQGIFRQREGDDWYAFTQFEALGARRAFPCFDEPDSKVPWQITLEVPEKLAAISNTAVLSEQATGRGTREVVFKQTPPLPSYLVAFAVGPFDFVNGGTTAHGTPVRIVVPRGRGAEVGYVVENTSPILALLEDYFGRPYPFDKLDLVAIPVTVGFGAMENPGLVTFNQRLLVARAEDFTIGFKRRFASTVAHELAHQWFGDLVTLAWWDDLWLNEAFASWMGDRVVRQWKPEWGGDVSVVTRRSRALGADALATARRIRQPIESIHDIENAFDGITYSKGASVIATFESFVGKDTFRAGVRAYVKERTWKNATASDFLAAIGEAAGKEITRPFSSFLDQVGAPLVGFELVCTDPAHPKLRLTQERYLPVGSEAERGTVWLLPVCVRYPGGQGCTLLAARQAEMELKGASGCPAWIAPNADGTGYYRSELEAELYPDAMSLPERVARIGDVNALVAAGKAEVGEALALVERHAGDESRHIVAAISTIAAGIADTVPDELRPNYARFIQKTFGARARELGFAPAPDDDDDTRLLRASLLELVTGEGEDAALAAEGRRLALAWLADRNAVDPDLAGVALEAAARFGDGELFERYLEAASSAKDRRDRQRLLGALSSFTNPELVGRALALVLGDRFDVRESSVLLYGSLTEQRNRRQVYEFVKTHLDAILTKMPERSQRGLMRVATSQCDAALVPEIETLFKARMEQIEGGPRDYAQGLELIELCVARRAAQRPGVVRFLARY